MIFIEVLLNIRVVSKAGILIDCFYWTSSVCVAISFFSRSINSSIEFMDLAMPSSSRNPSFSVLSCDSCSTYWFESSSPIRMADCITEIASCNFSAWELIMCVHLKEKFSQVRSNKKCSETSHVVVFVSLR